MPAALWLDQNYPNPFNASTTIVYAVPQRSHVTLTVYDILGRQVAAPVNGYVEAGRHQVKFDGTGLASGVYYYRLAAGSSAATTKALLLVR
jgi:hypothetical protein